VAAASSLFFDDAEYMMYLLASEDISHPTPTVVPVIGALVPPGEGESNLPRAVTSGKRGD
jgi:hypothetical protein